MIDARGIGTGLGLVVLAAAAAALAGQAVEHTSAPARAADLADWLAAAVPRVGRSYVVQASTAIMAHTGLGMLGVSVAPHPAD